MRVIHAYMHRASAVARLLSFGLRAHRQSIVMTTMPSSPPWAAARAMSSAPWTARSPFAASGSLSSRRISSVDGRCPELRPARRANRTWRPSPNRRLATAPRDYFGRDDTRIGSVVGYCARDGRTVLAVVTAPALRRRIPVLTHDGAVDAVELKSVEFAAPRGMMGSAIDDDPGVDPRVSAAPAPGGTSDASRRLAAVHAYATRLTHEGGEGSSATDESESPLAERAWRRALAAGCVPEHPSSAAAPMDVASLAAHVFHGDEEPALCESSVSVATEANVGVDLVRCYAAHVLVSGEPGRFRRHGRGRFSARTAREVESFAADAASQAAADSEREAAWARVGEAINAPPGSKPPPSHFLDGTVTQLRVEALEAYALGDGNRTSAQRAAAIDFLSRFGAKIGERSAMDTLVALGRWRGYEELSFARHDVPTAFPSDALAHAAAIEAEAPPDPDREIRKDLTRLRCYAIDGEGTVEVDDAVSAEALPGGKIRVWVHVADATRWVGLGTPLEAEAESRGASGYHPRGVLPMFPLPVAARLMSLTPGEPKCAVSVTAVIDERGETEEYWVGTSTIRVTRAATEGDVMKMLAEEPGRHEGLELLVEAARRRRELRLKRGAVDVRMPEATARVFDVGEGEGFVEGEDAGGGGGNRCEQSAAAVRRAEAAALDVRLTRGDHNDVKDLVGEAMILCGELIARFGVENGVPLPYRGQLEPRDAVSRRVWDDTPPGLCREALKRHGMRGANQGSTPRRHAGLGLDAYVQFSSPIRRYTDLLAHYQVKALLRGEAPPFDADAVARRLDANGDRTRALRAACRESDQFWTIEWYRRGGVDKDHVGTVVRWVKKESNACLVSFDETGVEWKCKVRKRTRLGDAVTMRVTEADPYSGRLVFAQVR